MRFSREYRRKKIPGSRSVVMILLHRFGLWKISIVVKMLQEFSRVLRVVTLLQYEISSGPFCIVCGLICRISAIYSFGSIVRSIPYIHSSYGQSELTRRSLARLELSISTHLNISLFAVSNNIINITLSIIAF